MPAAVPPLVTTPTVHAQVQPDEHGKKDRVEYPAAVRLPEIRHVHHLFRIGFTARGERMPPGSDRGTGEPAAAPCHGHRKVERREVGDLTVPPAEVRVERLRLSDRLDPQGRRDPASVDED